MPANVPEWYSDWMNNPDLREQYSSPTDYAESIGVDWQSQVQTPTGGTGGTTQTQTPTPVGDLNLGGLISQPGWGSGLNSAIDSGIANSQKGEQNTNSVQASNQGGAFASQGQTNTTQAQVGSQNTNQNTSQNTASSQASSTNQTGFQNGTTNQTQTGQTANQGVTTNVGATNQNNFQQNVGTQSGNTTGFQTGSNTNVGSSSNIGTTNQTGTTAGASNSQSNGLSNQTSVNQGQSNTSQNQIGSSTGSSLGSTSQNSFGTSTGVQNTGTNQTTVGQTNNQNTQLGQQTSQGTTNVVDSLGLGQIIKDQAQSAQATDAARTSWLQDTMNTGGTGFQNQLTQAINNSLSGTGMQGVGDGARGRVAGSAAQMVADNNLNQRLNAASQLSQTGQAANTAALGQGWLGQQTSNTGTTQEQNVGSTLTNQNVAGQSSQVSSGTTSDSTTGTSKQNTLSNTNQATTGQSNTMDTGNVSQATQNNTQGSQVQQNTSQGSSSNIGNTSSSGTNQSNTGQTSNQTNASSSIGGQSGTSSNTGVTSNTGMSATNTAGSSNQTSGSTTNSLSSALSSVLGNTSSNTNSLNLSSLISNESQKGVSAASNQQVATGLTPQTKQEGGGCYVCTAYSSFGEMSPHDIHVAAQWKLNRLDKYGRSLHGYSVWGPWAARQVYKRGWLYRLLYRPAWKVLEHELYLAKQLPSSSWGAKLWHAAFHYGSIPFSWAACLFGNNVIVTNKADMDRLRSQQLEFNFKHKV